MTSSVYSPAFELDLNTLKERAMTTDPSNRPSYLLIIIIAEYDVDVDAERLVLQLLQLIIVITFVVVVVVDNVDVDDVQLLFRVLLR